MQHSARKHFTCSASSAHRWWHCTASPVAAANAPAQIASEWAQEGTKAHELLQHCVENEIRSAYAYEGITLNSEYGSLTADNCASVQTVLNYFYGLVDSDPDAQWWTEEQIEVAPDCGGTSDLCVWLPSKSTLYVIDFKNGVGVVVEAADNKQLLIYALSRFLRLGWKPKHVTMTIVQPNAFHAHGPVREWTVDAAYIESFHWELTMKLEECRDHPVFNPGKEQCRWCAAAPTCPALEARALSVATEAFGDVKLINQTTLPDPRTLDLPRVAFILDAADLIETWLGEVRKYAYDCARLGHYVPGRKLVEAQRRRRWDGEKEEIAARLWELSGFTTEFYDWLPRKLITITDATEMMVAATVTTKKKGAKKKAKEEINEALAFLTVKESSGNIVMVPESDPRPAVNAVAHFGDVKLISPTDGD